MQDATPTAIERTSVLFSRVKELKSSHSWKECLSLLEEIWSTNNVDQPQDRGTLNEIEKVTQFQLELLQTWAEVLEAYIEQIPAILPLEENEMIEAIFAHYRKLALVHQRRSKLLMGIWEQNIHSNDEDDTDLLVESLLDWAISSKRAQDYINCTKAFWLIMKVDPSSARTDVIRLLGGSPDFYTNISYKLSLDVNLETPILFESKDNPLDLLPEVRRDYGMFHYIPLEDHASAYGPSTQALQLGSQAREIFASQEFTLTNCLSLLWPILESTLPVDVSRDRPAILNANVLFELRHEYLHQRAECNRKVTPFECLVELFMLGLAMEAEHVQSVLGNDAFQVLAEAGMLERIPVSASEWRLVGTVMVYPISPSDLAFDDPQFSESGTCLFVTDWPVESLLLPQFAVMSIGDDTLELLGLVVGAAKKIKELGVHDACFPILDMCCGCGVQGIFTWYCSKELVLASGDTGLSCGVQDMLTWYNYCSGELALNYGGRLLTMVDINDRAIHFATANLAFNGFPVYNDSSPNVRVMQGDLLETFVDDLQSQLRYKTVVSNPPFVPDPVMRSTDPFLPLPNFAVGGGSDGMDVLRRFLSTCFPYLDAAFHIYIVTEVPNVEHSCEMLLSFVPPEFRSSIDIRVAYVVEDVETIEEYTKNRETEAGTVVAARDWLTSWKDGGVTNRALVLISITKLPAAQETKLALYPFTSGQHAGGESGYDEDAFLMADGVKYVREHLL